MKANKHSIGGYQPICEHDGPPLVSPPKNPGGKNHNRSRIRANVGDHVLATKYSDGHAGDPWVVGIVTEIFVDDHGAGCFCLADGHNNTRSYRRAVRIKSNEEAELLLQAGPWLEHFNPLKSMYSVLGEYRKKKKPLLDYDPDAIDD